jgi:hypothetical protein
VTAAPGTRMFTEGVTTPSGAVLEVPLYPRHRVALGEGTATLDGTEVAVTPGQDPRVAATDALIIRARRVRGPAGAVRAEVTTAGSPAVWHVVVTATGDLIDATIPTTPKRGWWVLPAAAAAVLVLGAATATVLITSPTPTPPAATAPAPPPSGTPTPYPQLPPPGFAGVADWSAPVAPGAVPVLTDTAVLTLTGTTAAAAVTALDPGTGLPSWSVPLPRGAGTGGLHLAVIDSTPVVATSTGTDLLWWPLSAAADGTHPQGSVSLPPQSTVSWAGTTPLVTVPGQHAAAITTGRLVDRPVPAGATALGATTGDRTAGDGSRAPVIVAANSVGQLWRLPLTGDTTTIPTPVTLPTPAGATTLESVAGYTAPLPGSGGGSSGAGGDVLVTTWFTADPTTRVVALLDAHTGALLGSTTPAAASDVTSSGWTPSPRHQLGTLGPVLARTSGTPSAPVGLVGLPAGWRTSEVTDSAVYGTASAGGGGAPARLLVTPTGGKADLGSGSVALGVIAGRAVTTATTGSDTTLYGLPAVTSAPTPTPSVTVSAPPPLPSVAPTPAKAPTPPRGP